MEINIRIVNRNVVEMFTTGDNDRLFSQTIRILFEKLQINNSRSFDALNIYFLQCSDY